MIALYSFDKVLLANNQKDFTGSQNRNDRGYYRSPYKSSTYYPLIYDPIGQQRSVDTGFQQYEGLFIDKTQLNPGVEWGDAALGWNSPENASIEIQSTLSDENSTCGNDISYSIIQRS